MTLTPPIARRDPKSTPIHTTYLQDDYSWLRNKGEAEVTDYLNAENAHTAAYMAGTESLQEELYKEILSHIKEDDVSVPYRDGQWEYLTRTEKGQQYPRFCRRPIGPDGTGDPARETTILDVNTLAIGQPFMQLGAISVSPNGDLLAYTTDNTGFRQYTLAVKDLTTDTLLPDHAERVGSIVWTNDSKTIFYTTEDEQTKRQDRAFRHAVGSVGTDDAEVFHEPDERFNLGLGRTRDRKFVILEAGSHTASESWFLDAADPIAGFKLIAPRVDDEEYDVDHREGFFYIRTNLNAEQFRLVRTPVEHPGREHWQELLPENPEAPLEDIDLFSRFFVASYRERGLPVLRLHHLDAATGALTTSDDIRFPDPAYAAHGDINRDFFTTTYRYGYQSLVRPSSVFLYDLTTKQSKLLKQQEVPGDFNADLYTSERLWFKAHDGTEVPISLVYRKDKLNRPAANDVSFRATNGSRGTSELVDAQTGKQSRETHPTDVVILSEAKDPRISPAAHKSPTETQASSQPQTTTHYSLPTTHSPLPPLYVYGYGSYGYPLPLGFSASRLALLDRGLVMAYAHIRGGGELGDPWHDAGKMNNKLNTFTDFIEATEFLLTEGYGDPKRVAIEGGSAGGLLMGAVTNMRPDLFSVVLSHVPFVDVMNTMLDASLPLTVAEYEEWGNPNEPEAFAYMRSYSPYDNLDALAGKPHPAMLVKTSLNDSQVMYWEPAKYVAKLRTLTTGEKPILLHINMDAGHGGASGRYDYLKEIAFDDAFLLRELGLS